MNSLKTILKINPITELANFLYTYACYRYIFSFACSGRSALFQRRQIAVILRYAANHCPYFTDIMGKNPQITADNATEVLKTLPVLTKDIIRRENTRVFSDEIDPATCPRISTGGSSGSPLFFPMKHSPLKIEAAHQYFLRTMMGWHFNEPMAAIGGFTPSPGDIEARRFWSASRLNFPYGRYIFSCFCINDSTVADYISALDRIHPDILVSYPSALAELSAAAMRQSVRLVHQPRAIYVTSENLTDHDYHIIKQYFTCPLWEQYGNTEASIFAWRREDEDCLTVSPLYGYTEVLDEETLRPVKEGEMGQIFVTGFHNRGLPFIRYATDDFAVFLGRDSDGTVRLSRLQGRTADYLVNADGHKIIITGLTHYRAFDNMISWQMEQSEKGTVVMRIIKDKDFSGKDEDELRREFGSKKLGIVFEYPETIAKSKRGKRIFVIQHLK